MSKWITLRIELNTATADDVVDEVNSAILCKLEEDKKIYSWEWSELGREGELVSNDTITLDYVAYCLDCDAQLGETDIKGHNCWGEE